MIGPLNTNGVVFFFAYPFWGHALEPITVDLEEGGWLSSGRGRLSSRRGMLSSGRGR